MDKGRREAGSILVIEGGHSCGDFVVGGLISSTGEFRCETKTWDATNEEIRNCGVDLVVPVSCLNLNRLKGFFAWLCSAETPITALAVMPNDADTELLKLASEAAQDFVLWPARPSELYERVRRLVGVPSSGISEARRRLAGEIGMAQLVGNDEAFVQSLDRLPRIAASDVPVLVTGETGTGKELVARAIHLLSPRRGGPFVPVDCTAIPEQLLENELFGHARGAFTDAKREQKGLAAIAAGGTLFLDEIDALSLASQAKLLRLLQEGTFRALGSQRFEEANVRVVAATNQDLEACVQQKSFRSDLYFRLNVLSLHMPPLRERRGDIDLLARHFLSLLGTRNGGRPPKSLSPSATRKLQSYNWPGNIRELFNVMQRAVVFSSAPQILSGHILLPNEKVSPQIRAGSFREARAQALDAFERQYVTAMLTRHGGNITHAALEARKDRRAFGRLVKKHRIMPRLITPDGSESTPLDVTHTPPGGLCLS